MVMSLYQVIPNSASRSNEIGEKWTEDCQDCKCTTSGDIACTPIVCNVSQSITCNQPGYQVMKIVDPANPCCSINKCLCNISLCQEPISSCPDGLEPVFSINGCCVNITCATKPASTVTAPTRTVTKISNTTTEPTSTASTTRTEARMSTTTPRTESTTTATTRTEARMSTTTPKTTTISKENVTMLLSTATEPTSTASTTRTEARMSTTTPRTEITTTATTRTEARMSTTTPKTTTLSNPTVKTISSTAPKGVCLVDNKLYTPGSLVPSSPGSCTQCICTSLLNSTTELNIVICVPISCNKTCEPGETYENFLGQCCGKCVQKSCNVTTPDGQNKVLETGEIWAPNNNNCTIYKCTQQTTLQPFTVVITTTCEYNSIKDCSTGQEYMQPSTGQCCGKCVQTRCVISLGNGNVTLLSEGQSVSFPDDKCTTYTCVRSLGQLVTVEAKVTCQYNSSQNCKSGEEYVPSTDQCCGQCVQKYCIIITSTGETKLLAGDTLRSDDKCTTYTCVKTNDQLSTVRNTKESCTNSSQCGPGEKYEVAANECCGKCVQKTCVVVISTNKNITLQPGDTVPDPTNPCISYSCTKVNEKLITEVQKTICKYQSAKDCQAGEQYNVSSGKCCGECIPSACNIITASGEKATLKAGESWSSTKDKCISYGCTQVNGMFYSVLNNNTCPDVKSEDCESGVIEVSANGCCSTCKAPRNCRLEVGPVNLLIGNCPLTLTIPYCTGVCTSSTQTNSLEAECRCCKKLKSKEQTVKVPCKNGTIISYQYDYITSCGCSTQLC